MAVGVPTLVEEPMYADGFAEGIADRKVGGPEISELDAAITASRTTPPGLKPTITCAIYPSPNAINPWVMGATNA